MIRINLLPHREMRRGRRKKDFIALGALTALAAGAVAFIVGMGINRQIDAQAQRNEFIKAENTKLDQQIAEIANLRAEIDALKARQKAVEDLQSDRTTPVHLLDELVKQTPEGIFLKNIKQEDRKLHMQGYAQSQQRIADLMYNLANRASWMERPDLVESKAVALGQPGSKDVRTVYEFSMSTLIKQPTESRPDAKKRPGAPPDKPRTTAGPATGALATAANG